MVCIFSYYKYIIYIINNTLYKYHKYNFFENILICNFAIHFFLFFTHPDSKAILYKFVKENINSESSRSQFSISEPNDEKNKFSGHAK